MATSAVESASSLPDLLADTGADETIFVVDDEYGVRRVVAAILRTEGYRVEEFETGEAALAALDESVALLLTDISMPGINGVELARLSKERAPALAAIMFTGLPDSSTAAESLRLGASDYLAKPVRTEDLKRSVSRTLEKRREAIQRERVAAWLQSEVEARTGDLKRHSLATLVTLVRAMEAKDPYLKGGSGRIARLCGRMAADLGFDKQGVVEVSTAGLLHDIGMIGTPEAILHKTSALTPKEYEQVKSHVEVGANILQPLTHLGRVVEYVRYHHERLNGSGYLEGLKGDEIPLGAQIVGLAESYTAMTMDRPFRSRSSRGEALLSLRAGEGIWFHSRLLDALEAAARLR
jgi:putative nucleotidyltransferase with HDIG domain